MGWDRFSAGKGLVGFVPGFIVEVVVDGTTESVCELRVSRAELGRARGRHRGISTWFAELCWLWFQMRLSVFPRFVFRRT